jgi:hypothetical protein
LLLLLLLLCAATQAGICMVGMSSVLSGEGSSTHKVSTEEMLLGMGLIVMSQVRDATAATAAAAARVRCSITGNDVAGRVWQRG